MHDGVLVIVVILVFGCAAFIFGVLYSLGRLFAWIGRGAWAAVRPRGPMTRPGPSGRRVRQRVCPNGQCRRIEVRDARYCSQCGTKLG